MVWAKACEVGCAVARCPNLLSYYNQYWSHYAADRGSEDDGNLYYLVCYYGGPGYPEVPSNIIYRRPPYHRGRSCSYCPDEYPLCYSPYYYQPPNDNETDTDLAVGTGVDAGNTIGGLCCE